MRVVLICAVLLGLMALGTLAQCSFNTACDTCVTASCDWCPDAAVCVPQNTDINCRAQCKDVFSVEKDLQKVYDTLKDKVQLIGPFCRDSFGSIGYSGCRWWFRRSTADLHWCHDWLRVRSFASVLVVRSSSDGHSPVSAADVSRTATRRRSVAGEGNDWLILFSHARFQISHVGGSAQRVAATHVYADMFLQSKADIASFSVLAVDDV